MSDAQITITGNITRDPEYKTFEGGTELCSFGVAVNERRKNKETGDWEDAPPSYFNVVTFGQYAKNVLESLKKGDRVIVTGRMRVREFTRQDETKGISPEIAADEVGPSLRWAQAEVTKNPKGTNGGSAGRDLAEVADDYLS